MKKSTSSRRTSSEKSSGVRLPHLEPVRLYRQIADLITQRIDEGAFPIGTLLPSERELAEQLGVSRTTVREGLIALEVTGKIAILVGQGAKVLEAIPRADLGEGLLSADDSDIGPIQLLEARILVELKTVELATINRTEADLERMRQAIALQASAENARDPRYCDGDRAFHVEIARASGNTAYAFVVASLWDKISSPVFQKFVELLTGPERPGETLLEHQRILDAIARQKSTASRKAMKHHLDTVLAAFSRGVGDSQSL
jgi:DNA-binding FadR family transcriptional regulator